MSSTPQVDPAVLASRLTARFGVQLIGSKRREGSADIASIRPADIQAPSGFSIKLILGWRSVEAAFVPDTYAGNLIRAMGEASRDATAELAVLADTFAATGNRLSLRINESVVHSWSTLPPPPWHRLELTCLRLTDAVEVGGDALWKDSEDAVSACFALLLQLLPIEEGVDNQIPLLEAGLPEGAKTRVEVNRYERSPVNRAACIAIFGARCYACGFAFQEKYGEIGEGYIEVHHRVPVSQMGPGYIVIPAKDLIPLCSNCHSIVHRRDPALDVEELKAQLSA